MVSMFLEKFPESYFNENILNLFLNTGKYLFSVIDYCDLSSQFFDEILLNERIFTKFIIPLQTTLWKNLYLFYVSDVSQIRSFMRMKKIIIILRYYDNKKFSEFCCNEHNKLFVKTNLRVMDPPLNLLIESLISKLFKSKISYN